MIYCKPKPKPRYALVDDQGIIRSFWSREEAEAIRLSNEWIEELPVAQPYQPEEAPF